MAGVMAATVFSQTKPDFNQGPKVPIVLLQFPALSLAFLQLPFPPPALSFEVDAGGQRYSNYNSQGRGGPASAAQISGACNFPLIAATAPCLAPGNPNHQPENADENPASAVGHDSRPAAQTRRGCERQKRHRQYAEKGCEVVYGRQKSAQSHEKIAAPARRARVTPSLWKFPSF